MVGNEKCITNFEITSRVLMKESTLNKKCYHTGQCKRTGGCYNDRNSVQPSVRCINASKYAPSAL